MPKLDIKLAGGLGKVELDGKRVENVTRIEFSATPGDVVSVTLEVLPDDLSIEIDDCDVIIGTLKKRSLSQPPPAVGK